MQTSDLWRSLERAKRHLFYSIIRWNLPQPTMAEDPDHGLAFDFLADQQNADGSVTPVLTGHDDGLITINIAEGDDAEREKRRTEMGEPYRTLVGHICRQVWADWRWRSEHTRPMPVQVQPQGARPILSATAGNDGFMLAAG